MATDRIAGYIEGLLDGKEVTQTTYALDPGAKKSALAQFLCKAEGKAKPDAEDEPNGYHVHYVVKSDFRTSNY